MPFIALGNPAVAHGRKTKRACSISLGLTLFSAKAVSDGRRPENVNALSAKAVSDGRPPEYLVSPSVLSGILITLAEQQIEGYGEDFEISTGPCSTFGTGWTRIFLQRMTTFEVFYFPECLDKNQLTDHDKFSVEVSR